MLNRKLSGFLLSNPCPNSRYGSNVGHRLFSVLASNTGIDLLEKSREYLLYKYQLLYLCFRSLVPPPWTISVPRSFKMAQDSEPDAATDNKKPLEWHRRQCQHHYTNQLLYIPVTRKYMCASCLPLSIAMTSTSHYLSLKTTLPSQ